MDWKKILGVPNKRDDMDAGQVKPKPVNVLQGEMLIFVLILACVVLKAELVAVVLSAGLILNLLINPIMKIIDKYKV